MKCNPRREGELADSILAFVIFFPLVWWWAMAITSICKFIAEHIEIIVRLS